MHACKVGPALGLNVADLHPPVGKLGMTPSTACAPSGFAPDAGRARSHLAEATFSARLTLLSRGQLSEGLLDPSATPDFAPETVAIPQRELQPGVQVRRLRDVFDSLDLPPLQGEGSNVGAAGDTPRFEHEVDGSQRHNTLNPAFRPPVDLVAVRRCDRRRDPAHEAEFVEPEPIECHQQRVLSPESTPSPVGDDDTSLDGDDDDDDADEVPLEQLGSIRLECKPTDEHGRRDRARHEHPHRRARQRRVVSRPARSTTG